MNEIDALIDSSVLLAYKSGDPFAKTLMFKAIDKDILLGLTTFSLFNIWSRSDFDRKSEIGFISLIEYLTVIEIDFESAINSANSLRNANEPIEESKSVFEFDTIEQYFIQHLQNKLSKKLITNSPEKYNILTTDFTDIEHFLKAN
ncbi:MAG: hypothetical protein ACJ0BB_01610 [Dehalococcoidia bacterium]